MVKVVNLALLLTPVLLCGGCHQQSAAPPPPVPITPQGQQAEQQFLQNNANMPPQEKAQIQAQMHRNPAAPAAGSQ